MAHEAFALSPIAARAAQSGETDYEAIREAFMETARGRWFLGEYAKRNRHADTRMVLNAVARIERMLEAAQQPPPGTRLPEILAILSNVVDHAAETATSAVDGRAIEQRLAPIRNGARILKKISWRWREIGTESRICDSIDTEVDAIQESCRQLEAIDIHAALTGAFELIRTSIDALAEDDGKTADAVTKPYAAATAVHVAPDDDSLAGATMAAPDAAASGQATGAAAVPDAAMTQPERAETANAEDAAILGILAIATADHGWGDAAARDRGEPHRSEAAVVAEPVERASPAVTSLHPSLGATPFTNEWLEQRRFPDTDPFPAIRRMSLTEKIEFFS